mgnify:FL=1
MHNTHCLPELFKAWAGEGFGHDVGNSVLGWDVFDRDCLLLYAGEVLAEVEALHQIVEACLLGECDGSGVVAHDGERVREWLAKYLELFVMVDCLRGVAKLHVLLGFSGNEVFPSCMHSVSQDDLVKQVWRFEDHELAPDRKSVV